MDALIITVAGTSSRFGKSLGREALKCVYSESGVERTLLFRLLKLGSSFDKIIVVGGYRIHELEAFLANSIPVETREKVSLVNNPHFEDRGSGWSLHLAVEELKSEAIDSIVFAEGDLLLDENSFTEVSTSKHDVLTCNAHVIDASSSVAFYCDMEMHPHYLYDTSHGALEISEPFTRIYNSGQVWRFSNPAKLFALDDDLTEEAHSRTNLELINAYFSSESINDLDLIEFRTWINCNTVDDFRRAFEQFDLDE